MTKKERNRRAYELAKPAYDALMICYPLTLNDLDGEQWRPIKGYDNYLVSNYGRVKSIYKSGKARIKKPLLRCDYLYVNLYNVDRGKHFTIHRLVAQAFIPNPEDKPEVNHQDGHKMNCYVGNLEWTTAKENIQHAFDNGLRGAGENVYNAKLTNEQVQYIRQNPDCLTQEQLAEQFGVTPTTIGYVQVGKSYKNAGGPIRKPQKQSPRVPDEVRAQIRADYATGNYSQRALARKYGVSRKTIINILNEQ